MAKVELVKKSRATTGSVAKQQIKWCNCGHLARDHLSSGCKEIVEASESEDHYECPCSLTLKQLQQAVDIDNYG